MLEFLKNLLLEIRPRQWVKNLTIFTFLVFSPGKQFFILHQFLVVLYAVFIFTLLTSSVYVFNDIMDAASDRKNPDKKKRPIAAGKISIPIAIAASVLFFLASLILAIHLSEYLFVMCVLYAILMVSYSLFLKNLVIFDALAIAGGFVIRVFAGAFVINEASISSWVIIVTISLSLLLAFGKRRSEITLLGESESKIQRSVLAKYPLDLLNSLISSLVATTFLSYILLTFQTNFDQKKSLYKVIPLSILKNSTNLYQKIRI